MDPVETGRTKEQIAGVRNGSQPLRSGELRAGGARSMAVLPTLCTLGNLVAGFAALQYAIKEPGTPVGFGWTPLGFAAALVFLGLFLDAIDGSIARLMRVTSPMGAQIDSLADMVTFGVAPAFLAVILMRNAMAQDGFIIGPWTDDALGKLMWATAALYVCCAALRLAKFNLGTDDKADAKLSFSGLPSPGAAGLICSLIILHQHVFKHYGFDETIMRRIAGVTFPIVLTGTALLMVSSVPYLHFTNRFLRGSASFKYVARIAIISVALLWFLQETLAIAFLIYVLYSPAMWAWQSIRERKRPAVPSG